MLNKLLKGALAGVPKSIWWLMLSWLIVALVENGGNDGQFEMSSIVIFILGVLVAGFAIFWNNRNAV